MPESVYDVGDPITSTVRVAETPDLTTQATVTVQRPDGTAIAATPGAIDGDEFSVTFFATDDGTAGGTSNASAGDWLVRWKITGTGAGDTPKVYSVTPPPGTSTRPAWSPFLSDVADHVPFLTQDESTPGSQVWLGTFTGSTSPTDGQAQRHIDSAVRMISPGLGVLPSSLYGAARAVAALRAAATLCRAFARSADDRARADAMERQASADLKALQSAADDSGAGVASVAPVMYAPTPVGWGDSLLLDNTPPLASSRQFLWPE